MKDYLQEFYVEHHSSTSKLAKATGISRSSIHDWATGKTTPNNALKIWDLANGMAAVSGGDALRILVEIYQEIYLGDSKREWGGYE